MVVRGGREPGADREYGPERSLGRKRASQEWKSLIKRSKPLVTPFEGLQEPAKAYNGPIGR